MLMMMISIHSLRGEGDIVSAVATSPALQISIHSLRGEGDIYNFDDVFCVELFQSTPSVGRETVYQMLMVAVLDIFQSTPSVGRETKFVGTFIYYVKISIHSLRGEGDINSAITQGILQGISIHSLRGEGDEIHEDRLFEFFKFQSTPSVGRETI